MALFKVLEVVNGNTIKVSPWKWGEGYAGVSVKIQGYTAPTKEVEDYVIKKLKTLLENKSVELKHVIKADKVEGENQDIVYCSVLLNEIDIATYFRELNSAK